MNVRFDLDPYGKLHKSHGYETVMDQQNNKEYVIGNDFLALGNWCIIERTNSYDSPPPPHVRHCTKEYEEEREDLDVCWEKAIRLMGCSIKCNWASGHPLPVNSGLRLQHQAIMNVLQLIYTVRHQLASIFLHFRLAAGAVSN